MTGFEMIMHMAKIQAKWSKDDISIFLALLIYVSIPIISSVVFGFVSKYE
ncbi:MAG: hypothetical protein IKN55_04515 [Oscillospiraceae bacterium]|nr:hypothetical protein [Oscillospiraceae bacterium]